MGVLFEEQWGYSARGLGILFMIITVGLIVGNIIIMEWANKKFFNQPYKVLE